jgi:DNA-binding GntR family transcriptional regulator
MPADASATLGEHAYRAVREMIVNGELPAGAWLRKRRLADTLQMSATPVVEALRRLQHEGLVETEPQWGARVRVLTVAELEELSSMREVLEGLVATRCAERLSPAQITELRCQAEQVDQVDRSFTDPRVAHARRCTTADEDLAFHLRLAEEAGLPLVRAELERMQMLEATLRMWIVPAPLTRVPHVQIVDAIASGDPDRAATAMRRHIRDNASIYLAELRKRFGEGAILINADEPRRAGSSPERARPDDHDEP